MSTGRLCIITGGNHFVIGRGGGRISWVGGVKEFCWRVRVEEFDNLKID